MNTKLKAYIDEVGMSQALLDLANYCSAKANEEPETHTGNERFEEWHTASRAICLLSDDERIKEVS